MKINQTGLSNCIDVVLEIAQILWKGATRCWYILKIWLCIALVCFGVFFFVTTFPGTTIILVVLFLMLCIGLLPDDEFPELKKKS